jgi:hypothetical protein
MTEELETEIEGILINGADIIKFSDDGRLGRPKGTPLVTLEN